jgi:hypothetical protein
MIKGKIYLKNLNLLFVGIKKVNFADKKTNEIIGSEFKDQR